MLSLKLQTFIKYCHLDPTKLVTELDKRLNGHGRGHNFHWSLEKAIQAFIEGAAEQEIEEILNAPNSEAEAKYNRAAYENFLKKFGKTKEIELVQEERIYPIPQFDLQLKVAPLFRTYEKGQSHLHVVWAIQNPRLEQRFANIGTLVLLDAFKGTQYGNSKFCLMDLVKPYRYSDRTITDKTHLAFELHCRMIDVAAKSV